MTTDISPLGPCAVCGTEVEVWRPVIDYEGLYEVSNLGRLRSVRGGANTYVGRLLCTQRRSHYMQATLYKDGKSEHIDVHRLVARAFCPCPNERYEVDHKDDDKLNNAASNLEWVTRRENLCRSYAVGRPRTCGENHPQAKLTVTVVRQIRELASRYSQRMLAKQFGVCQPTICAIQTNRTWKHI